MGKCNELPEATSQKYTKEVLKVEPRKYYTNIGITTIKATIAYPSSEYSFRDSQLETAMRAASQRKEEEASRQIKARKIQTKEIVQL